MMGAEGANESCVACGLDYRLGCCVVFVPEFLVCFAVELASALDAVNGAESFPDDVEERVVGFL